MSNIFWQIKPPAIKNRDREPPALTETGKLEAHRLPLDDPCRRLIRLFERLRLERGLPQRLRVDNGPEFLSVDFVTWADAAGLVIQYIQKGEPNQNAYIERFNRTYREGVLNFYRFRNLAEVRETTHWWRLDYNERRPHDARGRRTPAECMNPNAKNSNLELSR